MLKIAEFSFEQFKNRTTVRESIDKHMFALYTDITLKSHNEFSPEIYLKFL